MIEKKYITQKREPFFEIARKYIKKNSKVLDVGAGDGAFSEYCDRKDFFLFEGNPESVNNLKSKFPNVFHGNLPTLPFEDKYFDIIHCSHVIEHLSPAVLHQTISEFDRCLKDGGVLVISAPLLWSKFYNDMSHIKPYNPTVIIKYLTINKYNTGTRSNISESYQVESLIYRYAEKDILEEIYFIKNKWFFWGVKKFMNLLYKMGMRKYEKSGFTLVIKR